MGEPPARELDLHGDEVGSRHHLGHGMLDLDPGVHLKEVEIERIGIDDIFDGAGAAVSRCPAKRDGRVSHASSDLGRNTGCRAFLDHLLEAPLQRAIALEQMDGLAIAEAEHLDFDMTGFADETFKINRAVSERLGCHRLRRLDSGGEFLRTVDSPHSNAAAAHRRLDQQWKADGSCRTLKTCKIVRAKPPAAGDDRNARARRPLRAPAPCLP